MEIDIFSRDNTESCDKHFIYFFKSFLAVLTSEGIVFITDFSHSKPPGSAGKKVYIASPHASPAHTKPAPAAAPVPTGAKKALNKVKVLITNEKPT